MITAGASGGRLAPRYHGWERRLPRLSGYDAYLCGPPVTPTG